MENNATKTIAVLEAWMRQPVLTPPPINDIYDAINLLKEQLPRLLSYEESVEAEYCVLELRDRPFANYNSKRLPSELHQFVHVSGSGYYSPTLNSMRMPFFEEICEKEQYGIDGRCWNKMPTKEQCENTPWKTTCGIEYEEAQNGSRQD